MSNILLLLLSNESIFYFNPLWMHHRLVSLASVSLDDAKGKADDACIQLVSKYRQQKRYISHKCTSIGPLDKCKGAFTKASIIKHSTHVSIWSSDLKRYFPCATFFYSSTPSKRVLSNSASTSFFYSFLREILKMEYPFNEKWRKKDAKTFSAFFFIQYCNQLDSKSSFQLQPK